MSDNALKKMIVFSNIEIKDHIETFLKIKAEQECQTQSKILEECVLQAMALCGDKWAGEKLTERYKRNVDFINKLREIRN